MSGVDASSNFFPFLYIYFSLFTVSSTIIYTLRSQIAENRMKKGTDDRIWSLHRTTLQSKKRINGHICHNLFTSFTKLSL